MKFLLKTEINGSLSFLDVIIFRENDKFVASDFRKETFSGVYTNLRLVEMKKILGGLIIMYIVHQHGWPMKKIFHFKSPKTARKT